MELSDVRREYSAARLTEADLGADPLAALERWIAEAREAEAQEPTAMTLATVDANGAPQARIVLLKGLDARGLRFFTNYGSDKGRALAANPRAALVFFWPELERQVRVEGSVVKVPEDESEAYFQTRPRASRLGAWASRQSAEIATREELERAERELRERYGEDAEIPRPPFWGGYRLSPERVEFWQGRVSRLHDRIDFRRGTGGGFAVRRLQP